MNRAARRAGILPVLALIAVSSAAPPRTFRVAVLADTHVGAGEAAAGLAGLVDLINARPGIDLVVAAGDLTEKGRDSEFEEAKAVLGRLRVPWRAVPGNHDAHWIGQGLAGFRRAFGRDRFLVRRGSTAFIGLDTWDFGHLAPEDLAWLENEVRRTPRDGWILLFCHAPPALVDNWAKAHNILRARRTVVISGHVHKTEILSASGLPAVTVRASIGRKDAPPGFVLLERAGDGLSLSEITGAAPGVPAGRVEPAAPPGPPEIEIPPPATASVEVLWRADLKRRVGLAPVPGGEALFVVDDAGTVSGISAEGKRKWSRKLKERCVSRPVFAGGALFVATAFGRIEKLEAATGRVLATAIVGERVTADLAATEGLPAGRTNILAGTLSGALYCLDGQDLSVGWRIGAAGDMIRGRPLAVGGRIVYGSWDARLRGVEAGDGRPSWAWIGSDNFYYAPAGCAPVSDGRRVFVSAPDGFVSAVDAESGRTLWRENHSAWESLALSPDSKRVLVKTRKDAFVVLEAASGKLLRSIAPAHGDGDIMPVEPLEKDGTIVYGAANGRVYGIDRDGRIAVLLDLGPAGIHTPVELGGGVLAAASVDGAIVAFKAPGGSDGPGRRKP